MLFCLPLRRLARVVCWAVAMPALALAESPPPLSLDEALRLAEGRSASVVAQDAAATAARESAIAAGQVPDPSLRLSIDALPINGPDRGSLVRDDFTMRSVGITQEFTRAAKRQARAARFEREADVAVANRAQAVAALQRNTALAWLDRERLARLADLLAAQRDANRLQIDAAEVAYRGGRGTLADVFAARSAVAETDDRIEENARQGETATTQLARWIGAEAARRPLAERPNTAAVNFEAADLEARFAHHPEIAAMQQREAIAEAEADIAVANQQSDWSVGVSYSKRGPAFSDYVFLSVSVPLQWDAKNRQDRELAAKRATVAQMRAEREEATRDHVAETLAMLQAWQSGRSRLKRFDASLMPLAAERSAAATAAYRGGTAVLAAVLDARRAETDVRIERLQLETETDRLWAQLTYLIPANAPGSRP